MDAEIRPCTGSLIFVGSAVRERVRFALDPTKTETANKDLDCLEPFLLYSLYSQIPMI